jgi:preprotein translocase subunit SecG
METFLSVAQVMVAIAMSGFILVQRGAGAAAGSGFGAGASGTVFGARGSASFLSRATAALAAAFFGISMVMAVMAARVTQSGAADDLGVMAGAAGDVASETVEVSDVPTAMPSLDAGEPEVILDDIPQAIPADEPEAAATEEQDDDSGQ